MNSDVFKSGYYTSRKYDTVYYFDVQETFIKVLDTKFNKSYDCPIFIQKGQDSESIFLKNEIVHPYDLNICIIQDIDYAVYDKCMNLVGRCKCTNIKHDVYCFHLSVTDHDLSIDSKICIDFTIPRDKINITYKVPCTDLTVGFSRILKENKNV